MNHLRRLITRLSGSEQSATGTGSQHPVDTGGGPSRLDAIWDEALMASIHCEASRMFLDHMGPR
jgi:hypothetical protein